MPKSLAFVFGLIAAMINVAQAGDLQVPEAFDVLAANGKEQSSGLQRTKQVPLLTGRNVIVIEYDQLFDAAYGDSHDRIRSQPFALVFEAGATDTLKLIEPAFDNGSEAGKWAVAPTVQIVGSDNKPITVSAVPVQKIAGEWLLPGTAVAALSGNTATLKPAAASLLGTPSTVTSPAATAAAPDTLQMLLYFWQQATPEQREKFLQSIGK